MWHKIIAGVFVLFAAFQYNDPDFYIWIPIYLIVAGVIWMYSLGKYQYRLLQILLVMYLIGMATYYADVVSWIQNGTPSITGSMQAESPFIEFIREFFGLGICALALGFYVFLAKKKNRVL